MVSITSKVISPSDFLSSPCERSPLSQCSKSESMAIMRNLVRYIFQIADGRNCGGRNLVGQTPGDFSIEVEFDISDEHPIAKRPDSLLQPRLPLQ